MYPRSKILFLALITLVLTACAVPATEAPSTSTEQPAASPADLSDIKTYLLDKGG